MITARSEWGLGSGVFPNSNTLPFTVHNPVPVLTAITPAQALEGSGNLNLNVTGEHFVPGSVVRFGTTDLTTTP